MTRVTLFFLLIMTFFSCKTLVHKFDNRLNQKYLKKGFIEKTIATQERNILYLDNQQSDKPVVIFIHGFGGDGKVSWWQQAKNLHEDYRVIIPDILWFGKSFSTKQPTLKAQIDMVKTIVDAEKLSDVNMVGISYGGFISLGYAKKYAQDLNTLTIVDSPGAVISNSEIKEFCERVGATSVQDAFIPENAEEVDRLMNFSFRNPPMLTAGIREETIGLYFSKYPEEQAILIEELPKNREWMSGQVNLPTLILWGEDDQVFLTRDAEKLKTMLGAELVVIEKAGHALPEEQPDHFNRALLDFLEKNAVKD